MFYKEHPLVNKETAVREPEAWEGARGGVGDLIQSSSPTLPFSLSPTRSGRNTGPRSGLLIPYRPFSPAVDELLDEGIVAVADLLGCAGGNELALVEH